MTIWPAPCPCCGAIATLSRHLFVLSTFCPQESHSFSTGLSTEQKQQKAPCIPTDVRGRREKTCRQRISMCLSVVNFIVYYAHFCQFRVREQSNPCMLKGRQKAEFFEKKHKVFASPLDLYDARLAIIWQHSIMRQKLHILCLSLRNQYSIKRIFVTRCSL